MKLHRLLYMVVVEVSVRSVNIVMTFVGVHQIIYNLSYYTTHNIVPNHGTIAKC